MCCYLCRSATAVCEENPEASRMMLSVWNELLIGRGSIQVTDLKQGLLFHWVDSLSVIQVLKNKNHPYENVGPSGLRALPLGGSINIDRWPL
jgi:hypothetical protein